MFPTRAEVIAFLLAWFRRHVWGLIKFAWRWNFQWSQQMRDTVLCTILMETFATVVDILMLLLKAGFLRQGRVLDFVDRVVHGAARRLEDFEERIRSQGTAPT